MPPAPGTTVPGWPGWRATRHRRSTDVTRRWPGRSMRLITWGWVKLREAWGGGLGAGGSARRGLPLLAAASAARDALGFPWRPAEASRIAGWIATGRERLREAAGPAWARGAGLGIEEAAVMARRGRGPRRRPAFGWASLTPPERDVADLVARGPPNPEI